VEDFCRTTSAAPCPTIQKLSATPDGEGGVLDLQVFRNRYKFDSLNLQDLVFADKTGQQACVSAWQGQKPSLDNPLKDEIVFLGGYYSTGDVHPTPFGTQPGVELVAAAAEADLGPSNSTEMGTVGMYFLKILLGIGVAACHHYLKPRYALIMIVGILGIMVFFGTFLAFYFTSYRANFVPFVLGLWIEQLYEGSEKAHEHMEKHPSH
jgi:CHASE2 domain-containing sensor protein